MKTYTITVKEYFNLMRQHSLTLMNGATCGWGAIYDADGKQLFNNDKVIVKSEKNLKD